MRPTAGSVKRGTRRHGGPGVVGYLVVAAVVAAAVAIYFAAAPGLSGRGTWFVIGESSGIAAAALLPIVVILAARLRPLEWLFGDMTRVYVAHAVLGMTMFALVSIHPLLYVTGTLAADSGLREAAHVIVPFHLVVLDWISYLMIAVALTLTLYVRLPFATWRLSHMLLGLAMVLTGYSILIDNKDFDTFGIPALRILLFVLYGLGTAAFLWVSVLSRFFDPKRIYEITDVIHHDEANATELRARPQGKPIRFTAGQYVGVDLVDDALPTSRDYEAHPYSIITPPDQDEIGLVIKAQGPTTERIQRIGRDDGAVALVHSAHGRLTITATSQNRQVWIGGGIGITPFLSMAAEMAEHPERYAGYEIKLIYCVDTPEHAFCRKRLEEYERRCPALSVHLWDGEASGHPHAEGILDLLDWEPKEHSVLLCGPEAMITALERGLLAVGVPHGQIRWERAIGPPARWSEAAPVMRRLRIVATGAFALYATLVVAATVGRAVT